jgi:hypothetical protein
MGRMWVMEIISTSHQSLQASSLLLQVNQLLYYTSHQSLSKSSSPTSKPTPTTKMNNLDSHPRVLSLSASSSPNSTNASTPAAVSRRASRESAHDAHHFVAAQEKTHKTLNGSIKKMWKDIKQHAVEHHRSVNAAYAAQYGAGVRQGTIDGYEARAGARHGSVV